MLPKDYAMTACLMVDTRWTTDHERLDIMFNRLGIPETKYFINGMGKLLPPNSYDFIWHTPPKTWSGTDGGYYHFRGVQQIIKLAKWHNMDSVLLIEDDCYIEDDFEHWVKAANRSLENSDIPDWDILYYGANHSTAKTVNLSFNLMQVFGSLTSHMVGFRHTVYDDILNFKPVEMIDRLIADILHEKYRAYAIWPNVAKQKPGMSTIWNIHTDYTKLMEGKGYNRDLHVES